MLYGPFLGDNSNLPSYDDIYPNYEAPIIHDGENGLQLTRVTWGIPSWKQGARPITNVRNLESRFWRTMLERPQQRCLVPVSSFCEWTGQKGAKRKVWFGLKDATIFSFAGIWKQTDDGPRMAFLTCAPNALVGAVHPKAMPVILAPQDYPIWLNGDYSAIKALARPFETEIMVILM